MRTPILKEIGHRPIRKVSDYQTAGFNLYRAALYLAEIHLRTALDGDSTNNALLEKASSQLDAAAIEFTHAIDFKNTGTDLYTIHCKSCDTLLGHVAVDVELLCPNCESIYSVSYKGKEEPDIATQAPEITEILN